MSLRSGNQPSLRIFKKTNLSLQNEPPEVSKITKKRGVICPSRTPGGEASLTAFRASLTVEAALALTLFLFFFSALLGLFPVLEAQVELRYAMEAAGEETAMLAYLSDREDGDTDGIAGTLVSYGLSAAGLRAGVLSRLPADSAVEPAQLSFLGSEVLTEDDDVLVRATGFAGIPFVPEGTIRLTCEQRVYRRAWTGRLLPDGETGTGEEASVWVYVAENGIVYHTTESCTHLNLSISSTDAAAVGGLRNQFGAKYYPCERCGGGGCGTVYITTEGNRYHADPDCAGLKRTISRVRREEISLPACSRCGGSAGE